MRKVLRFLELMAGASAIPLMAMLISGCGSREARIEKEVTRTVPQIHKTAEALWHEYKIMPAVADRWYMGKIIEVAGYVSDHGLLGANYISLYVGEDTGDRPDCVMCSYSNAQEDAFRRLGKGQYIRVKGKCDGHLRRVVFLRGCVLCPLE